MKYLFPMVLAVVIGCSLPTPSEAFSLKKLTLRKVLGVPFAIAGFSAALVTDVVVTPFAHGVRQYNDNPPVKGW